MKRRIQKQLQLDQREEQNRPISTHDKILEKIMHIYKSVPPRGNEEIINKIKYS